MHHPEALYHKHKQEVYHLCLRFCGGQIELAEDLTHDVFVKLLEQLPRLSSEESLSPWLYRVTSNACYTRLHRERSIWKRVVSALGRQPQPTPSSPEKQALVRQELREAMALLQHLPSKERIVFCMHVLDDVPQQEICTILSLSKGYVSSLLKKARERMQKGVDRV